MSNSVLNLNNLITRIKAVRLQRVKRERLNLFRHESTVLFKFQNCPKHSYFLPLVNFMMTDDFSVRKHHNNMVLKVYKVSKVQRNP